MIVTVRRFCTLPSLTVRRVVLVRPQAFQQKKSAMKLNDAQIERTLNQMQAEAVPPDHPLIPRLVELFGEHTYFLNSSGLTIVEPVRGDNGAQPLGLVVNVASWADENSPELRAHEPEATDILVAMESGTAH
jgi:hypothetical protein